MRSTLFLLALAAVALAPIAAAHATAYSSDNKVKIVYGFTNEPAVTYTKNGLDLILSDNVTGAPISGAEKTLTKVELVYSGATWNFTDFKFAFGKPGSYSGVVTPTKAGRYDLHIVGSINGSAVDVTVQGAHDVEAYKDTLFPTADGPAEVDAKLATMQTKIDTLTAQVAAKSATPATVVSSTAKPTPGFEVGLLAIAAVGAVLLLRRRA
jgi:MYXO-CTERM domain-containing protein